MQAESQSQKPRSNPKRDLCELIKFNALCAAVLNLQGTALRFL